MDVDVLLAEREEGYPNALAIRSAESTDDNALDNALDDALDDDGHCQTVVTSVACGPLVPWVMV